MNALHTQRVLIDTTVYIVRALRIQHSPSENLDLSSITFVQQLLLVFPIA